MRRIVVVGGSIAAVTAAGQLRTDGWDGELIVLSEEPVAPYSRVPLSKGVLAGTQPPESATLAALPDDVDLRLGHRATALHTERHVVELASGEEVPFDGLVIATGARARRLAGPGQRGELVVRTMADAQAVAHRVTDARTAVVVGAGFLGMEVASTLQRHGLSVTVVDRDPPLQRLLGSWLAGVLVARAVDLGVRFVLAPDGVSLVDDPVAAVDCGSFGQVTADVIVSAVGDTPNVEWLADSGLPIAGGLVTDAHCRVAPHIVAAGDVTVQELTPGVMTRTPHWTNAVGQARTAARTLLDTEAAAHQPDHYFWTEQFDVDLKIAGRLPLVGEPEILAGELHEDWALLQWRHDGHPVAAAALNHRLPIVKLKKLATR